MTRCTSRPLASEEQLSRARRYASLAAEEGGEILEAGQMRVDGGRDYFMRPQLVTNTHSGMTINWEEVFGPIASVLRVRDYDHALCVANDTRYRLSARYLHAVLAAGRALQALD